MDKLLKWAVLNSATASEDTTKPSEPQRTLKDLVSESKVGSKSYHSPRLPTMYIHVCVWVHADEIHPRILVLSTQSWAKTMPL